MGIQTSKGLQNCSFTELEITANSSPDSDYGYRRNHGVNGLVDCGADGEFLDVEFVKQNNIPTWKLTCPILVNNVDRSPNEHGPILEVADLVLQYKGHRECALFTITQLGKETMILGLPWLQEHNPEVNWATGEVKMSQCPEKCKQCRMEEKKEKKEREQVKKKIQQCRVGPFPELDEEEDDEEDEEEEP